MLQRNNNPEKIHRYSLKISLYNLRRTNLVCKRQIREVVKRCLITLYGQTIVRLCLTAGRAHTIFRTCWFSFLVGILQTGVLGRCDEWHRNEKRLPRENIRFYSHGGFVGQRSKCRLTLSHDRARILSYNGVSRCNFNNQFWTLPTPKWNQ